MKQVLSMSVLAVSLALLAPMMAGPAAADAVGRSTAPPRQAPRPCGSWDLWSLRGTYAFSATAWQDLSQINPALPTGYAPVTIIGTLRVNGNGDVTGWAAVNAGGIGLTAEFVNSKFSAPGADCSIPITLSMHIKEFEGVTGPYPYIGAIAGDASALEIVFMMRGMGPGSHVELDRAKRISMNFD